MTEQSQPDPNMRYMRAENDGDRIPEFKEKREQVVNSVDSFLQTVLKMQMNGNVIKGNAILWYPVISEIDLGPSLANSSLRTMVSEYKQGISLTGDGDSSPLSLQYVQGDVAIKIKGPDPLGTVTSGTSYDGRHISTVARVYRQEGKDYFGADIRGDGSIGVLHFKESDGIDISKGIRDAEDFDKLVDGIQMVMDEVLSPEVRERIQ